MYEVRSHYSFWGEPDRKYKKCFKSLWDAYWYMIHEDYWDTSHKVIRVTGNKEVEVKRIFLDRNYEKKSGRINETNNQL